MKSLESITAERAAWKLYTNINSFDLVIFARRGAIARATRPTPVKEKLATYLPGYWGTDSIGDLREITLGDPHVVCPFPA